MLAESQLGLSNLVAPAAPSLPLAIQPPIADALDSTTPGTAALSGRFAGGTAPETRSYNAAGLADAAKRVNVVPGLFSGVSRETEQALGAARRQRQVAGTSRRSSAPT